MRKKYSTKGDPKQTKPKSRSRAPRKNPSTSTERVPLAEIQPVQPLPAIATSTTLEEKPLPNKSKRAAAKKSKAQPSKPRGRHKKSRSRSRTVNDSD